MLQAGAAKRRSFGSTSTGGCDLATEPAGPGDQRNLHQVGGQMHGGFRRLDRVGDGRSQGLGEASPKPAESMSSNRSVSGASTFTARSATSRSASGSSGAMSSSLRRVDRLPAVPFGPPAGRNRPRDVFGIAVVRGNSEDQPTLGGDHVSLVHFRCSCPIDGSRTRHTGPAEDGDRHRLHLRNARGQAGRGGRRRVRRSGDLRAGLRGVAARPPRK